MSKTHFVFDFDDTISNSYDHNQNLFYQTFIKYYPEIDEVFVRTVHKENRGIGMQQQFQMVIDQFELDLDAKQLVKENEELHVQNYQQLTVFKDVANLFEALIQKGKKISLCTNRQYDSLNAIIDNNNLRKYFTEIISCKDEGFEKPDPTCLINLIAKYNEPKDNYIYFGDSKVDYEFAANANIDFIIIDHYLNEKNFYSLILKAFL